MHLDAVLAAAVARRDDGSLSAPLLEDQDGISLLCKLLYERSTAGRAYLFIAVTDEGHLRVVRLLALYQKMQGVHADQYTRFHIQYAGAGSNARSIVPADGEWPTPGLAVGQYRIYVPDQQDAGSSGCIALVWGDEVVAVVFLLLKARGEAKPLETLL